MALLSIVTAPDPRLKKKSEPVIEFNKTLETFCSDMLDTIYQSSGVGLAAVQVGVLKRIMVIDLQGDDDHDDRPKDFYPLIMINPEITTYSEDKSIAPEGCLSVPEVRADIVRPNAIDINYVDQYGKAYSLTQQQTHGWLARCIQHEIDHLNGVTLLQYLSSIKREIAIKKLKKIKASL